MGEVSVTCLRAGMYWGRPCHEIIPHIVVVVDLVVTCVVHRSCSMFVIVFVCLRGCGDVMILVLYGVPVRGTMYTSNEY